MLETPRNSFRIDAGDFGPFGQGLCFSCVSDQSVAAAISLLSFVVSPPAVFWTVWAIVIDAINRISALWTSTHVGKKVFKFLPTFANFYSSAAVVLKRFILLISTTTFNGAPCIPLTANLFFSSHAMTQMAFPLATAACASSVSQGGSVNGDFLAANTKTEPPARTQIFEHRPMTVSLSCFIDKFRHDFKFITTWRVLCQY